MTTLQPLAQADSLLPRFDWDDIRKRAYLSYRLCGFGRDEAVKYSKIKVATVYHWRQRDPVFEQLEKTNLIELRQRFSREVITLDFTRNLKLALERDSQVLDKAVRTPAKMTPEEQRYLEKIRPLYTPQQLQILEGFIGQLGDGQSWDEILIMARRNHAQTQTQASSYALTSGSQEYPESSGQSQRSERGEEEEVSAEENLDAV